MALQCRMVHLGHLRMLGKEVDYLQGILYMALDTQTQGLDTLQQDEGIERRDGGTSVTQDDGTNAGDVGGSTNSVSKHDAVVRGVGFGQCREFVGVGLPVELAAVDNDTT